MSHLRVSKYTGTELFSNNFHSAVSRMAGPVYYVYLVDDLGKAVSPSGQCHRRADFEAYVNGKLTPVGFDIVSCNPNELCQYTSAQVENFVLRNTPA